MKRTVLVCVVFLAAASASFAQQGPKKIHEHLDGYAETPLALSTPGKGQFHARIDGNRVAWELSYSDLTTPVTQAHIHFGSPSQTGGVSVFLCTNVGGPAGTQACPTQPARITGTIEADDVIGPAGQGIAAMEFAEFLRALRADSTYVNVHTEGFPLGEIRAQILFGPPGHNKH